jgi:hypothetical protein
MTRYVKYSISLLLFGLGCATTAQDVDPGHDRPALAKADLVGSCQDACGDKSHGNCWCDDACEEIGDCCGDKPIQCDGEYGPCVSGFELVPDISACLADASCYALEDGSWCTGACPFGTELDLDGEPACLETAPCLDGFEQVAQVGACLADAACFELPDGSWCTGECPGGTELGNDEDGSWRCFPAQLEACLDSFEGVPTVSDCLADALCYALEDGSWCTGECPPDTELVLEGGPACVPADDAGTR